MGIVQNAAPIGKDITQRRGRSPMVRHGCAPGAELRRRYLHGYKSRWQSSKRPSRSYQMKSMQKQQLESEKGQRIAHTLDELKKASDDETVYKFAGSVIFRTTRDGHAVGARREARACKHALCSHRQARVKTGRVSSREQEAKITEAMRRGMTQQQSSAQPSSASSSSSSSSSSHKQRRRHNPCYRSNPPDRRHGVSPPGLKSI